jgi:cytochrome c
MAIKINKGDKNMRLKLLAYPILFALLSASSLFAAEKSATPVAATDKGSDAKRANDLLVKAVNYYKVNKDRALPAFNRQGEFIDGEFYVYVLGTNGFMLASGGSSSELIGRDVSALKDVTGKPFMKELIDTAKSKGSGKVEYRWLNRVDRKIEPKIAYFQRVDDVIISVGYYIPRASSDQAKVLLDQAVAAVKADPNAAFAAFNDLNGKFIQDDLYVFAVDTKTFRMVAHGANPRLVGTDTHDLTDPTGDQIIKKMIKAVNANGTGKLEYKWRNPVKERVETKHTLLHKVDKYLVAVGYYTR